MNLYPEIPDLFWSRLCAHRCVAFVGAGFSLPTPFPTWKEMVQKLVDMSKSAGADKRAPQEFQSATRYLAIGEYAAAANVLVTKRLLEPAEMARYLQRMFESPSILNPQMLGRLDSLQHAPWAGILTTNYDKLIEENTLQGNGFCIADGDNSFFCTILADPSRFIAKLHGESWRKGILTVEDYHREYIRRPFLTKFLESVMMSRHLVFIGCSLEPEILQLRRNLYILCERSIPEAYALLPKTPENELRYDYLRETCGIEVWLYDANDSKYPFVHGAIDDFLVRCSDCRDAGEIGIGSSTTQLDILRNLGRAKRMLLRAVLACSGQRIAYPDFINAVDLQRAQVNCEPPALYYHYYTSVELDALAKRFLNANLLQLEIKGSSRYLKAHPDLAANITKFDY